MKTQKREESEAEETKGIGDYMIMLLVRGKERVIRMGH